MSYLKPLNYIYKKSKRDFLKVLFIENISTITSAIASIKLGELIRNSGNINITELISLIIFLSFLSILLKIYGTYQIQLLIKKIKLIIIRDLLKSNKFNLISNNKYEILTTIRLSDNMSGTLVFSSMGILISSFGIVVFSYLILKELNSVFSVIFIIFSSIWIFLIFLYVKYKLRIATNHLIKYAHIRDTNSQIIFDNSKEIIVNIGEDFILDKSLNLNAPVADAYIKLGFYQIIPTDIIRYISIIIFSGIIYISIITGNNYQNILSAIVPLFLLSPYVLRLMSCLSKTSSVGEFINKIDSIKV